MRRATLSSLFLLAALAPLASAQRSVQESPQKAVTTLSRAKAQFSKADTSADGRVTLREAQAAGHSLAEFRAFDADGDSAITQEEFLVGYADKIAEKGGKIASEFADEVARIKASRQKRRSEQGEDPQRRSDAAREQVRDGEVNPERAEKRLEQLKETKGTPETARGRASDALSRLRENRQERRTEIAESDAQATSDNVSSGPAARRVTGKAAATPEEMRKLLRERQRRAAQENTNDPRAKEARTRAQEKLEERKGASGRDGARKGAEKDAKGGRGRGPAAGRSGRAGATGRAGSGRGN